MVIVADLLPFWNRIPRAEKVAISLSVGLGVILLALKFYAYSVTQSAAIFSDAVESIVNVLASMVALWALSIAHTPPDENHPYGHGKVEFISAAFEGGMIVLAALFIFIRTIDLVFFHKTEPAAIDSGLILMIIAMVLNGAAGLALIRVGNKQQSITLEADGQHLLADAVTSIAVIVSLVIVRLTGWHWADPIMAIVIAIYIAVAGIRMAQRSFGGLMDQQDVTDEKQLTDLLEAHATPNGPEPRICSYHKLRHRHSGRYHWVDFHIMVPRNLSVADGHRIASSIEYKIETLLGQGNATAHVEPCDDRDCLECKR